MRLPAKFYDLDIYFAFVPFPSVLTSLHIMSMQPGDPILRITALYVLDRLPPLIAILLPLSAPLKRQTCVGRPLDPHCSFLVFT